MKLEFKFLLLGAQKTLTQEEQELFDQSIILIKDWGFVLDKILLHHLGGLFYKNLKESKNKTLCPSDFLLKLKKEYLFIFARNTKINYDFKKLNSLLSVNNIDSIPLKGMVLKELVYGDLGLRKISDVDLLVRKKDLEEVKDIMLLDGWRIENKVYRNSVHEVVQNKIAHHPYVLVKENLTVELHTGIHMGNHKKYNVIIDDIWDKAERSLFLGEDVLLLNQVDMIIHLCIHTKGDFFNNKIKLKSFIDLSELFKKTLNNIDVELLFNNASKYNCAFEMVQILLLCNRFLSLPLSSTLKKKLERYPLDEKYELLFCNVFKKNLKSRAYLIYLGHLRKIQQRKQIQGVSCFFKFWIGFVFPSKFFVLHRFEKRKGSKFHFKLYRFFRIIK